MDDSKQTSKKRSIKVFSVARKNVIRKAATLLQHGEVVAFPTETVYGLGGNAFDPEAIHRIFTLKGRPADNPLIIHIADWEDLRLVAKNIPPIAKKLAASFWPGPLTLVLEKKPTVPDIVTAGVKTVAVRMPNHPMALALIRQAGFPIAAPSANLSGKPSPTDVEHVQEDFGGKIPLIVDGGKTEIGLESTVIDLTKKKAVIVRSGAITTEDLQLVLGYKPRTAHLRKGQKAPSPGMKYRHYAPQVPLLLFKITPATKMVQTMQKVLMEKKEQGLKVAILCPKEHVHFYKKADMVVACGTLKDLHTIGRELFSCLRQFTPNQADIILAESIPTRGIGKAVMDRLGRAAANFVNSVD